MNILMVPLVAVMFQAMMRIETRPISQRNWHRLMVDLHRALQGLMKRID